MYLKRRRNKGRAKLQRLSRPRCSASRTGFTATTPSTLPTSKARLFVARLEPEIRPQHPSADLPRGGSGQQKGQQVGRARATGSAAGYMKWCAQRRPESISRTTWCLWSIASMLPRWRRPNCQNHRHGSSAAKTPASWYSSTEGKMPYMFTTFIVQPIFNLLGAYLRAAARAITSAWRLSYLRL